MSIDSSSRTRGGRRTTERVTIRFPTDQIADIESLIEDGKYPNRSEVIRDSVRQMINDRKGTSETKKF